VERFIMNKIKLYFTKYSPYSCHGQSSSLRREQNRKCTTYTKALSAYEGHIS
jgi:hypothetical protein